ncbi:MAG TPA: porin [Verrucomicrobiae bacterium]|jgi:phosphate-selective porin OprO/OprP
MKNKTKLKKLTVATLATVASLQFALPAHAADTASVTDGNASNATQSAEVEALKKQVEELAEKINALQNQQPSVANSPSYQDLDQKVRVLERERELDKEDTTALAKTQPKFSLGANGFSFSSADTNFVINLHGLVQLDSRTFLHDNPAIKGNDGFILRRARPIITGTVFKDFDFNFTPDFGGSTVQIQDAYINYRFNSPLQLEVGKFKSPVGLEQLQTDNYVSFNERSIANNLVPNRDLGVELHGDLLDGELNYAAGIFNGSSDYNGTTSNQDTDDNKSFAGRLFAQPWKNTSIDALRGLGFGVGGSYGFDSKGTSISGLTPGYTTDGQQKFFTYNTGNTADGTHWRVSPQAYYYYGPFSLLGEYIISDQRVAANATTAKPINVQNTSWELSAGWVLTGEDAGYNGVTPRNPFNLHNGQWGAFQVVARYATVDVDDAVFQNGLAAAGSASEARAWSTGLNWYLNKDIRVSLSYSYTDFSGGGGTTGNGPVTAQPESVLFTRVQLAF